MHAAGVRCDQLQSCCLPVLLLPIPSSGFVRACMWGANTLQEGRTHAPFGAGRCSSQGARLALFSTRIQGGARQGSLWPSALCLPCRRRWARARASTLACMGVSPKGNVFWHRAAQQPQHSIYRYPGRRSVDAVPPPPTGSAVLAISPKALCKSACVMQAALCYSLSLPLGLSLLASCTLSHGAVAAALCDSLRRTDERVASQQQQRQRRERERGTYCTYSTAGGELDEGEKTPR
jgi:hypothetical protein